MKKKIISLFLTFFIFFNNVVSSFANPLAAIPISYELLMALMGIGVAYGLALPETDEEYWDYTRSLKKNLQVVDDEYLRLLEKTVFEYTFKNQNKPEPEKEPLKIPWVPSLSKLFENVGKEVQNEYKYVNNIVNPIPNFFSSAHTVEYTGNVTFDYVNKYNKLVSIHFSTYNNFQVITTTYIDNVEVGAAPLALLPITERVGIAFDETTGEVIPYAWTSRSPDKVTYYKIDTGDLPADHGYVDIGKVYKKNKIEYNPVDPNPNSESEIELDKLPHINIPNKDTIPNTFPDEVLSPEPPFEVSPEKYPDTEPSPEPEPEPEPEPSPEPEPEPEPEPGTGGDVGADTGFPDFPSFGDSISFEPFICSNITEKFPFSLPWDLGRIFDYFNVTPKAPIFEFPIVTETITIDFTEFDEWAMICRFFIICCFSCCLILISTKMKP